MMNLFSIFDPTSSMFFSLNWLSILMFTFILPLPYWYLPPRSLYFWIMITNFMFYEFKLLIKYSFSNTLTFICLFIMIFFNNMMGLIPYTFTSSSHINFNLTFSLSLWFSLLIFSMFNYINDLLAHLLPLNTPMILMPFMIIIESISFIIRPMTLTIRLTANMIAGHMLLSLIGSTLSYLTSNPILFNLLIFTQILLFMLEISVSLIQAYVYAILITLYSSEN